MDEETYYKMMDFIEKWQQWHLRYQDVLPGESGEKSANLYEESMNIVGD